MFCVSTNLARDEEHTSYLTHNRALVSDEAGLSLRELQIGLCCMDPTTPHGALSAQFRCQFIFQFYNTSGNGLLSFEEFM